MRYIGLALAASAFVLSACAGGDRANPADTTAAGTAATGTGTGTGATTGTPAATTPGATNAGAQPATGTRHRVRMVFENGQYKFVPADITVKAGDAIDFVNESGGPHNVAFNPANVPDDVEKQLDANMPATVGNIPKMAPLNGPLLTETSGPNSVYTISFARIKAGQYPYVCTPHETMGMKGTITVQ